jgi:hypothetical protein
MILERPGCGNDCEHMAPEEHESAIVSQELGQHCNAIREQAARMRVGEQEAARIAKQGRSLGLGRPDQTLGVQGDPGSLSRLEHVVMLQVAVKDGAGAIRQQLPAQTGCSIRRSPECVRCVSARCRLKRSKPGREIRQERGCRLASRAEAGDDACGRCRGRTIIGRAHGHQTGPGQHALREQCPQRPLYGHESDGAAARPVFERGRSWLTHSTSGTILSTSSVPSRLRTGTTSPARAPGKGAPTETSDHSLTRASTCCGSSRSQSAPRRPCTASTRCTASCGRSIEIPGPCEMRLPPTTWPERHAVPAGCGYGSSALGP